MTVQKINGLIGFGHQLRHQKDQEKPEKQPHTDGVAEVERHRHQIASRLTERSGGDLHDPEAGIDRSQLAHVATHR